MCYHEMAIPIVNKGGFELSPLPGHLGGREPMVKPTREMGRFCVLKEGVSFLHTEVG
jgi:hypothetical protein